MSTIFFAAGLLRQLAAIRPLYLAIWCGLGGLSVLLVVLMRSRWGESHPLHRCAVLSLLVHLVLACVAMTVRLVVGDGGTGAGPPIQVRLVEDPIAKAVHPPIPPPLLETQRSDDEVPKDEADAMPPVADELVVPESEVIAAGPAVEPPPLLEAPLPDTPEESIASEPDPATPLAESTIETEPAHASLDTLPLVESEREVTGPESVPAAEAIADAAESVAPPEPAESESNAVATNDNASHGPPLPTPYARRSPTERLRWAEEQGGSQRTEAAVAAALEWLAEAQSPDGRWDASRFGAGVEMAVLGHNRGGAGADADAGISALALLAFLGAGNTHEYGEYRTTVRRGLESLVKQQANNGNLGGPATLYSHMYCHSMATFALAEALAMTGDRWLEPAVRRAAGYSIRAQNHSTGGWRYKPGDTGDPGDTSQLGWQLMALWSAERAGVEVPPQTWTGAERFLRTVRRGNYGGLASYRPDGPASPPMTAEALYCRQLVRETIGGPANSAAEAEATAQLLASRPESRRLNLYYWYYATLALHHQQHSSDATAMAWQAWNSALTSVLLGAQVADGANAGSWDPSTVWGGYGGRVYSTAIAALSLEVYYRYAPPAPDPWMATRPGVRRLPQR